MDRRDSRAAMCPVFRFLIGDHTISPLHPAQKGRPAIIQNIEPGDCGDSQTRWSRLLDLKEIPSNLQPHSVDEVTRAFGSSGAELSFLHPVQKSPTAIRQINSNLTCLILNSFLGINRKIFATPIFT